MLGILAAQRPNRLQTIDSQDAGVERIHSVRPARGHSERLRMRLVSFAFAVALAMESSVVAGTRSDGATSAIGQTDVGNVAARSLGSPAGYFIENRGQVAGGVRYYALGNPSIGFRDDGAIFVLRESAGTARNLFDSQRQTRLTAYLMKFEGARVTAPAGRGLTPQVSNFFFGNDPAAWNVDVPSFREVVYSDIYDGVSVVYRLGQSGLKYDLILQPGADLGQIEITYEGIEAVSLEAKEVVVRTALGEIHDVLPRSYQADGGSVSCEFASRGAFSFGFECDGWDGSSALTIDPLAYSTFLGGTQGDYGNSIKVDSATGDAYVAGYTGSTDFPTTPGSYRQTSTFAGSGFVTKVAWNGTYLIYSTYIGGAAFDGAFSLAVDSAGSAYITGYTESSDFPTTLGAYNRTYAGGPNYGAVFALKLSPSGDSLAYSTYLGTGVSLAIGTVERPYAIAVDGSGNAYVTGHTTMPTFPTTAGAYDRTFNGGAYDSFLTKLNASGDRLVYSTYLGGSSSDHTVSVALDSNNNAYVTGLTGSANYPTTGGAYQTTYGGDIYDAFVTKVNAAGNGLIYSTFVGSPGIEESYSIAVDGAGSAFITGVARHNKYPTTPGAFSVTMNGPWDAFVTKFNTAGSGLVYSTFLGGAAGDEGYSICLDPNGLAVVTGIAGDNAFPTTAGAYDRSFNGGISDVFLTKMNAAGGSLVYSTFLGGNDQEQGLSVGVSSTRDAYVTGDAWSSDYPTTPDAFDTTLSGTPNGMVTRVVFTNNGPTANAGSDFTLSRNIRADLDGSASSDPDGDLLHFAWTQVSGPPATINNATQAVAWIQPQSLGIHNFMLTVHDYYGAASTDNVIVTVVNDPPVSSAGPDAFSYRNTATYLDGMGSSDPNGDPLTYAWTQLLGPDTPTINGPDQPRPWFATTVMGLYRFQLNVSDPFGAYALDTVDITIRNRAPVADAGVDHSGRPADPIILDGSASYDLDGDAIIYSWTELSGPSATITNSTQAVAWLTTSNIGVFHMMLEARDAFAGWTLDFVNITVANAPPVAEAGPDQIGYRNVRVDLDGSGSTDIGGTIVSYLWTQTSGPAVTLNNPNAALAWFTPTVLGNYAFTLTVTDNDGAWDTDSTNVAVVNRRPLANAGTDAGAFKNILITLDGSLSSDPDGDALSFLWTKVGGPGVTLTGADTDKPTFTPTASGVYVFNLTVNDGFGGLDWGIVNITVTNRDPIADAGMDQTVAVGSLVTLDGSASSDPDGDPKTFAWTQTSGPAVMLTGADTAKPTFTPTVIAIYSFQLRVSDNDGGSRTDTMTVNVVNGLPPVADARVWPGLTGHIGTVFVFDGSNSTDPDGTVTGYLWDFGDMATDPRAKAPHTFGTAQIFTVTLTVTDNDGMTNWTTLQIDVVSGTPPVADIKVWPAATGYIGTVFVFDGANSTDPDGSIATYSWELGDGNVKPGAKITHSFTSKGQFTVNLTVTDNDLMTDMATVTILILNRRPVIVSHLPTSSSADVAANHSELFSVVANDPDGDVLAYTWRLDAVQVGADSSTYTFNESALRTYVLNITVSDGLAEDWYQWAVTVSSGGNGDNNPQNEGGFPWWVVIIVIVVVVLVVLLLLFTRRKKHEEPTQPPKTPAKAPSRKEGIVTTAAKPAPKSAAKPAVKPAAKPAPKPAVKPPAKPAVAAPAAPPAKHPVQPSPATTPTAPIIASIASAATPVPAPAVEPVTEPAKVPPAEPIVEPPPATPPSISLITPPIILPATPVLPPTTEHVTEQASMPPTETVVEPPSVTSPAAPIAMPPIVAAAAPVLPPLVEHVTEQASMPPTETVVEPPSVPTPASPIVMPPIITTATPVFAPVAAHAPMLAAMPEGAPPPKPPEPQTAIPLHAPSAAPAATLTPMLAAAPEVTPPPTSPEPQSAIPLHAPSLAPAAVLPAKPATEPPGMQAAKPEAEPEAAPAMAFCPTCGRPVRYIETYERWYCYSCKEYYAS